MIASSQEECAGADLLHEVGNQLAVLCALHEGDLLRLSPEARAPSLPAQARLHATVRLYALPEFRAGAPIPVTEVVRAGVSASGGRVPLIGVSRHALGRRAAFYLAAAAAELALVAAPASLTLADDGDAIVLGVAGPALPDTLVTLLRQTLSAGIEAGGDGCVVRVPAG